MEFFGRTVMRTESVRDWVEHSWPHDPIRGQCVVLPANSEVALAVPPSAFEPQESASAWLLFMWFVRLARHGNQGEAGFFNAGQGKKLKASARCATKRCECSAVPSRRMTYPSNLPRLRKYILIYFTSSRINRAHHIGRRFSSAQHFGARSDPTLSDSTDRSVNNRNDVLISEDYSMSRLNSGFSTSCYCLLLWGTMASQIASPTFTLHRRQMSRHLAR
jgi:hypothetical protein